MKHLSSQELLSRTKSLAAEELRVTLSLIEHLEEISRRMLYAELGYASLWEFATRELGLSEGAAQRRIQAMRLVRDVPEAKVALKSGTLSLSNAAKVQSFRQAEKKLGRKPDAGLLVTQVEGLSQRECEKKLFEISPEALPRERERIVSAEGERELKIVVGPELYEKLARLKGLLAHAMPDATYEELLDRLATDALARLEKQKGTLKSTGGTQRAVDRGNDAAPASTAAAVVSPVSVAASPGNVTAGSIISLPAGKRVYLPVALRKAVWNRGQGQCELVQQGRRCSSRYRLEIDHIQPLSLGGSNDLSNLRLACWHHNQQQAREKLGACEAS
jgi:5-methylcytosine-specific restriction endonuclease McrA